MIGSNHYQMRNDENTRDAMEAIFDDGLDKTFFKTDKRNNMYKMITLLILILAHSLLL
jgi:hypothetical protein